MALLCEETFSGVEEFLIHSVQFLTLSTPISLPYTHTHTHTHTHTQSWFSEDKPWVVYWFPRVQSLEELNCECNLKNQSQPHSLGECDEWGRNCSFAQSSKWSSPLPPLWDRQWEEGGRMAWGLQLSFFLEEPLVPWTVPSGSWLFTWWASPGWVVWLVNPQQNVSSGWDRLPVAGTGLKNGRNLFVVCKQEPEFGLALVILIAGQAGKRILEDE